MIPSTAVPDTTDPAPAKPRLANAQARLALVARLIQESAGRMPTHLQLLNELRRRGVKSSKGSVMNDLASLGVCSAPSAHRSKQSFPNPTPQS